MASKHLLEVTLLAVTIGSIYGCPGNQLKKPTGREAGNFNIKFQMIAVAEYQCVYTDDRVRYCDDCCEYDCCASSSSGGAIDAGGAIGAGVGGGLLFLAIVAVFCICVRRRRLASREGIVVRQPSSVLVVSSTIQTSRVTPGIATPGLTERPMYNPNVPQTGTYAYEQPTTFAASPSGYIPRKETLAAEPPPPYIPQN